jgi:Domain of unknown function (DUF4340)
MQLRNTIIVMALLAVVGGFALYVAHNPKTGKNHLPFTITADDIAKIELQTPTYDIEVERGDDGAWVLTKPVASQAEGGTVDSMAGAIANLEVTDTVDAGPGELADFGLAKPAVSVTVTTKDKRVLPTIIVGGETPVGNSAYIKLSDSPTVLLVASSFPPNVEKNLDDLRSHALISLKSAEINRIVIAPGNGAPVELDRKGDNWSMVKPSQTPADNAAVQKFLDAVTAGQISEFVADKPDDLAKYGLANPSLRIDLYGGKNNREESLLFGFKVPEAYKNSIYVRRGDTAGQPVASVADYLFTAANKSFDDLRDKTVLAFDESNVEQITVAGGPPPSTIARAAGGKWTISSGGKSANAEVLVAESLLDQLHDLHGTKIVENPITDPKRYGMERPSLIFTLYSKDGKEIGWIKASELEVTVSQPRLNSQPQPPRRFGYATTSANQAVYEVGPQSIGDLGRTINRLEVSLSATPTPAPSALPQPSPSATAK